MKKSIIISFVGFILLLSSCKKNYEKNWYQISDVNLRLVEFDFLDSNGCLNLREFSADTAYNFVGVGILFEKSYYSDSTVTRNFSAENLGYNGFGDTITNYSFELTDESNKTNLKSLFQGKEEFCCVSTTSNIHYLNGDRFGGALDKSKNCFESVYYQDFDAMIEVINSNEKRIRFESGLYGEVFFWIEKQKLLSLFEKETQIILNLETRDRGMISDSISISKEL